MKGEEERGFRPQNLPPSRAAEGLVRTHGNPIRHLQFNTNNYTTHPAKGDWTEARVGGLIA
jgi:hypothetical protein